MLQKLTLSIALSVFGLSILAQETDSVEYKLEIINDVEQIDVLHQLILSNWLKYPAIADSYAQKSIELSELSGDSALISKSLRLMAGVYYYKGDYETSLDYNQRSLALALALQNDELINNCYNNIGLIYYNLGSYPQALEYLLLSLKIKDRIGLVYGKSTTLNNIGLIFQKNREYEKARSYFSEGLLLAKSTGDSNLMVYSNNNIGVSWLRQNQIEKAKAHFEQARSTAENVNNVVWGSISLRGLGEVYQVQGKLKKAHHYYMRSLDEAQSIEDKQGLAESFRLLSKYYLARRAYKQAITMLDSSQHYAMLIKSLHIIENNLLQYISIEEAQKNRQKVIQQQNRYIDYRDSLFRITIGRELDFVPVKLEEEAKRINMESQIKDIERYREMDRIYLIILLFSIPIIVVLILLLSKIRTSNLDLRQKNKEIESQSSKIEAQNSKLNLSIKQLRRTQNLLTESEKMASIGQLVGGLAHELNNPLNFIGGIIKPMQMNLRDMESYSPEIKKSESYQEMHSLLQGVEEGTERASTIIEKLKAISPKLRTQEKENFDFADCVEETIELLEKDYSKLNCINNLVTGPIIIVSNYYEITKILYAIIQNAVQSVLENITKNRNVSIEAEVVKHMLKIIVQDNGPGIKEKNLKKIYEPFFTTKLGQGASGLGLFVAQTLVERNKGKIKMESQEGVGTTFTITIPI